MRLALPHWSLYDGFYDISLELGTCGPAQKSSISPWSVQQGLTYNYEAMNEPQLATNMT